MNIKALLDIDLVALESAEKVTMMLDMTAPITDAAKARPGQAVEVVLDRSGSMSGEVFESAKESILKLIERLAPQDSFGLIAFDDNALVVAPMRTMADHHLPSLRNAICDMQTGGSTDISGGYTMGLRELSRVATDAGATLLLISDGHANAGEQDPKVFAQIASTHTANKITTSTIGLGTGYDETILEALAQGGSGAHRFAYTIDEAVGAIAAEVEDLLEKSVVNAVMRFTPSPALTTNPRIEILQRLPYYKDGDTYVVQLGDLYAGENRRFVIDIEVPGMASLGLTTIADITLEYLDVAKLEEISVSMPVQVNVVPDDVAKGRLADPIVRAERLIIKAQSEKAAAIEELRGGKSKDAANRLKGTAESLRREASSIRVTDDRTAESLKIITSEADEMDALAKSAEYDDIGYSSKRLSENFSEKTRSRKMRNRDDLPKTQDEYLNPGDTNGN
jgi:Ca-activated chloride channel family protein